MSPAALAHLPNWHSPRNDACAQNNLVEGDCTCERPKRVRKGWRTIRVTGPTGTRLVLRIWPNGTIGLRDHGRRTEIFTTAWSVRGQVVFADAVRKASQTRAANRARRKNAKG